MLESSPFCSFSLILGVSLTQVMSIMWFICFALTCCCSASTDIDVAVFLYVSKGNSVFDFRRLLPALEIARETISHIVEIGEYANFTLRWVVTPERCAFSTVNDAIRVAAKLFFEGKALAYFGPSCSGSLVSVADFAASVNVPIFSGSAGTVELYNKIRYPTATQTIYDSNTMVSFLRELFFLFGWDSYVLLRKGYIALLIKDSIENSLREADTSGFTIFVEDYDESCKESLLREQLSSARVSMNFCILLEFCIQCS